MATFTNYATLSYDGGSTVSNTVTGELLEVLALSKTAVVDEYIPGSNVTYVLSLVNSGTAPLTGLTVTDDLGGYDVGGTTVYPLAYTADSVLYYNNGVLQTAPTVTAGPPLAISGITVPAGGNATLIYQATVTEFASPQTGGTIVNTATATGGGLSAPLTASETVTVASGTNLSISKNLSPAVIAENGQLTYTFVIENAGNVPAEATDNLTVTDVFNPILENITVTYNGAAWTEGVNYTYDEATGTFATLPGQITVPAAAYTQNPDGTWETTPGYVVLTVSGTV